jgi:hypothetical protein
MSDVLISALGQVLQNALAQLRMLPSWPDPASGFAYRLFKAIGEPYPDGFTQPLRMVNPLLLRRAPELAAFGYVIDQISSELQADWAQALARLMGRDAYPSDRNSFIHSPFELLGVAFGLRNCPATTDEQRAWLIDTIGNGVRDHQFLDTIERAAATCAVGIVNPSRISITASLSNTPALVELKTEELLLMMGIEHLFVGSTSLDLPAAEQEIATRVMSVGAPVRDTAEVAALSIALDRVLQRALHAVRPSADPVAMVTALCRRFPLFVDRLQSRQRDRLPFKPEDEYDVQDLLHAILKLHFDDVRPEEWTPSYAGSSSRTDFLLARERVIIEAKMTRHNLKQREAANQLIIDVARYSKMPQVDNLVCLVYDPERLCTNPTALEDDIADSDGRLRVTVVVCPHGI